MGVWLFFFLVGAWLLGFHFFPFDNIYFVGTIKLQMSLSLYFSLFSPLN